MTNKTYKEGDVVHVQLDEIQAQHLTDNILGTYMGKIIAHIPAPKPVVRWVNAYDTYAGHYCVTRREVDEHAYCNRTCVLRIEWPDGDMSKPLKSENVTVEDVR